MDQEIIPMTEADTTFSTKDQICHWQQPLPIIFFEVTCLPCFMFKKISTICPHLDSPSSSVSHVSKLKRYSMNKSGVLS